MSELPKKAWSMNATAGLFYVLSLGALVALAGCAGNDDDDDAGAAPAPTSTATRIGVMGPFQGPNALLGEQIKVAAEMAFAEINYRIGSKEIELVFIDSSSDPSVAVPNYEDAIVNQNVIAGFSNWHSDVSLAVMDVVADHGIPHYFAGGQSDEINAKHDADPARYGVWLKGLPSPSVLHATYAVALEEAIAAGEWDPGPEKTLAIYHEDTAWGRSVRASLAAAFTAEGWTVLLTSGGDLATEVSLVQTDFRAELEAMRDHPQGSPDLIAGSITTEVVLDFLSDFRTAFASVNPMPLLIVDTITVHRNSLGSTADGVLDLDPRYRDTVAAQQFIDDFTARLGVPPSSLSAGVAYDYARFFIDLLNVTLDTHGELTSANIREVGESQLKTGQLSFTDGVVMTEYRYSPDSVPDPETGNGLLSYSVVQYNDSGDSTVVWPAGQLRAP